MVSEAPKVIDLSVVPAQHRDRARDALSDAFPLGGPDAIEPGPAGASGALTFRVRRGEGDVLLRVEGTRMPGRNPHQYRNLRSAAAAGIAPPVLVADGDAGVMIMEWVDPRPLTDHPGGPEGLLGAVGELLAEVQRLDPFPADEDWAEGVSRMLSYLVLTGRFAPGALDDHVAAWDRIRDGWTRDPATFVPAHNDPNATNFLFDGTRLWLVDWETSAPNDPLVDLAVVSNQLAPTPELADVLLGSWGGAPDDRMRARLRVAQQAAKLWAACALAMITAGDGEPIDLAAPTIEEFMGQVSSGEVSMSSAPGLATFSAIVFNQFLDATVTAEFATALSRANG
jgi:aminoglycoside phosphotransferase (APT) family kinase protein